MKDSWGPLKALAAASILNFIGCILLCTYLGHGIVGAACATMISQVVAAYMMIQTLNTKGYNAFAFSIPSWKELLAILGLAAPVFITLMSKVAFYSLPIYFATSMGTHAMAAHQLMVQTFCMCTVWGEPLSQTAHSFMAELIYGVNWSLSKAVPTSKGQALAHEYGIKFFETSAKTNLNVEEVFLSIARDIKQRLADTDHKAEPSTIKINQDQAAGAGQAAQKSAWCG